MNHTTRLRRGLAVVAGLVAASLALSGCLYSMIPEDGGSAAAPSGPEKEPVLDGVPEELLPFYDQQLDWESCGDGFDCATVTAPLDWNDPEADDIELSIVRQRALSGNPVGSLLTNPGGPGASGVDLVADSIDFAVGTTLQESFDVIGFDPRGVGKSTAVQCLESAEMTSYLYDIPTSERGSDEWEDELAEQNQEFADACEANSDGILPYITTDQSARDMDLLRAVLGDSELYYLGYSYGTFLGATYAKIFPERVGRLVLDGAIDPSVSGLDVGALQGVGFEEALRVYMQNCLDSGECPFSGTVDDAMADLSTLLASVDRDPIEGSDGRMLGADSLLTAIIAALYSEENWPILTQALDETLSGNAETAFLLADFYNSKSGDTYSDNSTEAFTAYNCMDYPVSSSDAAQEAVEEELAEKAPTVAPYWSGPDVCDVWPYPPSGVREPITAPGAAPIVVVGTTGDPATPYAWAEALADQLESGTLVTYVGEGHTGYNKGDTCVDSAVEEYLVDGTVPEDGLRCE